MIKIRALVSYNPVLSLIAGNILLAAVYFGAAKSGLLLSTVNSNVTLVWPASGIAVAVVLLFGYRMLPGIALGTFLVTFATPAHIVFDIFTSVGNPLEAAAAAWMLNKAGFCRKFTSIHSVIIFLVYAVMISTTLSAGIGVTGLYITGSIPWSGIAATFLTWWVGDAMGVLIVTPLILSWITGRNDRADAHYPEISVWGILLCVVSYIIFARTFPGLPVIAVSMLPFPFLIWALVRFGARGVTSASFVISYCAIIWVVSGSVFSDASTRNYALYSLWFYITLVAVSMLFLLSVFEERDSAQHELRELLNEKEILIQEVHHRVKNNMQIMRSILNLHGDKFIKAGGGDILCDMQGRISAIARVHEHLYAAGEFAHIQFSSYIESLVNEIAAVFNSEKFVSIKTTVDAIDMPLEKAVPCGLIVTELLTNACKYAFTGGNALPEITVQIHRLHNGSVSIKVQDNGCGFNPDAERSETSIGLNMVRSIAMQQLGGSWNISAENGTCAEAVFFPVSPSAR